ncbi:MAG: hypothetical protein Q9159_007067 [Coniocarpon cinnabarinum]
MTASDPRSDLAFPRPKATPLRFKSSEQSPRTHHRERHYDTHGRRHRKHHRRSDHDRHTKPGTTSKDENAQEPGLDPDAAFRESLFDALADDEGADYWSSIYGQPIHTYPASQPGPDGKLERMTDDEYVEYVRAEMWKKTNAGLFEEKERRAKARREAQEHEEEARKIRERIAREREELRRAVEASLDWGTVRHEHKREKEVYERYQRTWERLGGETDDQVVEIAWPTFGEGSGAPNTHEVERFMRFAASSSAGERSALPGVLKVERVRWHPDKVQQRAKGRLDEETIRKVTAVFQIIDDLYMRHKRR